MSSRSVRKSSRSSVSFKNQEPKTFSIISIKISRVKSEENLDFSSGIQENLKFSIKNEENLNVSTDNEQVELEIAAEFMDTRIEFKPNEAENPNRFSLKNDFEIVFELRVNIDDDEDVLNLFANPVISKNQNCFLFKKTSS